MSEHSPLLTTSFPTPDLPDNTENNRQLLRHLKVRLRYYIPFLSWLPKYKLDYLQDDVVAGFTVAFLVIPQSLSYAQALVHIPPVLGLITAFVAQFVYAFLGTSRQLAVGPEALVSILAGSTIREFRKWRGLNPMELGSPDIPDIYNNIQPTTLLCLLVGLLTFLLGFFRLGFLDSVLSRALLRGFIMAVACVVVIEMGNPILGLIPAVGQCGMGTVNDNYELGAEKDAESPFQLFIHIFQNLGNSHALTTSISVCSIIFLFTIRYLKFKYSHIQKLQLIPEILVLVVVSTILSFTLRWDCHGVVILNKIEQKIPDGVGLYPVPTVPKIKHLFLSAILISVIGFVESIAVAKKYAAKHRYNVSPNRELVALGAGNSIIAFFGGFPAFGSLGRSAVNDSTGARTQMAGFVAGFVVLATYLWLLPFFEYLPKAVCSAIIVVAAVKLMEFEDIVFMFHLRAWNDLALMLITFCSTIFISIEIGTLLSVGISLLLVVRHTTTTRIILLGEYVYLDPESGIATIKYKNLKEGPESPRRIKGMILIRFEEGLFFGNVGQLKEKLKRIELHGDLGIHPGEDPIEVDFEEDSCLDGIREEPTNPLNSVIFDMKAVSSLDASATETLKEIAIDYQARNINVGFVKVRPQCMEWFKRSEITEIIPPSFFFTKIRDAVRRFTPIRSETISNRILIDISVPRSMQSQRSRSASPAQQSITSFDALREDS